MGRWIAVMGIVTAGAVMSATPVPPVALRESAPKAVSADHLERHGVDASKVQYGGREAIRLIEADDTRKGGFATVDGLTARDGTIDVDVAGRRGAYAKGDDRGFIGIAFRVTGDRQRFECIYLRPDNGRADDQLRRNHSTQYISHPDFPWQLLREQFPGKYESYVDLESGAWTPMRIVVEGPRARLYVHGASQPTLIVNDLKLPPAAGGIAFWIGPGTEGFFSNLRVSAEREPGA